MFKIEWLNTLIDIYRSDIAHKISHEYELLNADGIANSSSLANNTLKIWQKQIRTSINLIIRKMNSLKELNENNWETIKNQLIIFIDKNFDDTANECEKVCRNKIDKKVTENITLELELNIEIKKQEIREIKKIKRCKMIWDIVKVLLSAILGGFIARKLF
jgi:hypothetical protein